MPTQRPISSTVPRTAPQPQPASTTRATSATARARAVAHDVAESQSGLSRPSAVHVDPASNMALNIRKTTALPEAIQNRLAPMKLDFNTQLNSDGSSSIKNFTKEHYKEMSRVFISQFSGDGLIHKLSATKQAKISDIKLSKTFLHTDKSKNLYRLSITAQETSKKAGLPDAHLTPKIFEYSLTQKQLSTIFGIEDVTSGTISLQNTSEKGQLSVDNTKVDISVAKELEAQLNDAKNQLHGATNQLDDTKNQLNNATSQLDDTKNQLNNATNQLDDTKNQLNNATSQLDDTKSQLNDAILELNRTKSDADARIAAAETAAAETRNTAVGTDAAVDTADLTEVKNVPYSEAKVLAENQLKQSKNNLLPYILSAIGLVVGLVTMGVTLGVAAGDKKDAEKEINDGESSVGQAKTALDNAEKGDYHEAGEVKGRDALNQEIQKDQARYQKLDSMPPSPENDLLKQEIAARYTSTSDGVPVFSESSLTDLGTETFQETYNTAYREGVSEAKAGIVDAATKQLERAEKALSNAEKTKDNANKTMLMGGAFGGAMSLLGLAGLGIARKRHQDNIHSGNNARTNIANLDSAQRNNTPFKATSVQGLTVKQHLNMLLKLKDAKTAVPATNSPRNNPINSPNNSNEPIN